MSGEKNDTSIDRAVDSYQRMIQGVLDLEVFKSNPQGDQAAKDKSIVASKEARGHFFNFDYLQKYRSAVATDAKVRDKQYEAMDSIDYYNKKYLQKD